MVRTCRTSSLNDLKIYRVGTTFCSSCQAAEAEIAEEPAVEACIGRWNVLAEEVF